MLDAKGQRKFDQFVAKLSGRLTNWARWCRGSDDGAPRPASARFWRDYRPNPADFGAQEDEAAEERATSKAGVNSPDAEALNSAFARLPEPSRLALAAAFVWTHVPKEHRWKVAQASSPEEFETAVEIAKKLLVYQLHARDFQ